MDGQGGGESREFWLRVWQAIQRIPALMVFAGAHYLLNWVLKLVTPSRLGEALILAQAMVFIFFLLVYFKIGWDMVKVFVPSLEVRKRKEKIGD